MAKVIRSLHGGCINATLDLQLKNLRYRTATEPVTYRGLPTPFVRAVYPRVAAAPLAVVEDVEQSLA